MTLTYTEFAIALLDDVLGSRDRDAEREVREAVHLQSLGFLIPEDAPGIVTKGCPRCKGTMYRTEDKDGRKQFICSKCGHIQ